MTDLEGLLDAHDRVAAILVGPVAELGYRDDARSGWSVAQHLHHALLANRRILAAIDRIESGRGDPPAAPGTAGRAVLKTGRIPRGFGRRPPGTVPADAPAAGELLQMAREARAAFAALAPRLDRLAARPETRLHPALGAFTATQWLRFAEVHLRHHLAIVDELRATRRGS